MAVDDEEEKQREGHRLLRADPRAGNVDLAGAQNANVQHGSKGWPVRDASPAICVARVTVLDNHPRPKQYHRSRERRCGMLRSSRARSRRRPLLTRGCRHTFMSPRATHQPSRESHMLEEGAPAPDFTAQTDSGTSLILSGLRGKPVVLYFYPKDDTPG